MNIKFRELKADEIDVRIGTIGATTTTLVLYKDARVDMCLLDEVAGPMNWQRRHYLVGENLHCEVSIWDDNKSVWVCKSDVGTESYTEKEKGEASDSFKRACVNWGIGRALYSAKNLRVYNSKIKFYDNEKTGKKATYDTFKVSKIEYKDGEILSLEIVNQAGNVVCTNKYEKPPTEDETKKANEEWDAAEKVLFDTAKKYGFLPNQVQDKFYEVKKKQFFSAEPKELLSMATWYNNQYGGKK